MRFLSHLGLQLVDPRGRCNRTDFLHAAIAMFLLQTAVFGLLWRLTGEFDHVSVLPANVAFVWMGYAAVSRRLHDLGHSAWWMPAAVAAWLGCGFVLALLLTLTMGAEQMFPGSPLFWVVFACLLAPPLLAALWLHVTEGQQGSNRFGPPSGDDTAFEPASAGDLAEAMPAAAANEPRRFAAHA